MTFASYVFLFVFLPLLLIVFFLIQKFKKKYSIYVIIIFSLFFYVAHSLNYLSLLLITLVINFFLLKVVRKNFFYLILLILLNISILIYYKFFGFLFSANYIFPLGISFYIFNQIAFIIDFYYQRINKPEFVKFFFLIIYFPHLIAGPFLRYNSIISQLRNKEYFDISYDKFFFGLLIFSVGLFKKVILADNLGVYVDNFHIKLEESLNLESVSSWLASLSFSLQLYFDFSGYSDMAIGMSMFFGILLPTNFNSPYKSTNIVDFWRRWHTTLGNYIFEFIYVPISIFLEKRFNFRKKALDSFILTSLPIIFSFLLVGLWHGSGRNNFQTILNFTLFGLMHGFLSIYTHMTKNFCIIKNKFISNFLGTFITFNFVNISFIFSLTLVELG